MGACGRKAGLLMEPEMGIAGRALLYGSLVYWAVALMDLAFAAVAPCSLLRPVACDHIARFEIVLGAAVVLYVLLVVAGFVALRIIRRRMLAPRSG